MLKYLNCIKSQLRDLLSDDKEICNALIDEINTYYDYSKKYSSDISRSPLYKSTPQLYNIHNFNLPEDEPITISWDVDFLYKLSQHYYPIEYMSLYEFEKYLSHDISSTQNELDRIDKEITSLHNHTYTPILIIDFKPFETPLIIDGRHRYIEYKRLKSSHNIPCYIIDDEFAIQGIMTKKDLVNYIILHNISTINNYITGKGSMDRIISLKVCMGD